MIPSNNIMMREKIMETMDDLVGVSHALEAIRLGYSEAFYPENLVMVSAKIYSPVYGSTISLIIEEF